MECALMADPMSYLQGLYDQAKQQFSNLMPTPSNDPSIKYDSTLGTAGKYSSPSLIRSIASKFLPVSGAGTITVNPNNTANVDTTIKHERVHALLDKYYNNGTLDKLNEQNPFYSKIAPMIGLEPGGDASVEAPAYTATGESKQMNIPTPLSQGYNQYLQKQLFQLDPNLATAYGKLSQ